MLPQFNFIAAQAGADACLATTRLPLTMPPSQHHPPPFPSPTSTTQHQPPKLLYQQQQQQQQQLQFQHYPPPAAVPAPSSMAYMNHPYSPPNWQKQEHRRQEEQQPQQQQHPHPHHQHHQPQDYHHEQLAQDEEEDQEETQSLSSYDPYHTPWDQEQQTLADCNNLLKVVDSEFLEHSEAIYHSKFRSLQKELQDLQDGSHEGFLEAIADLEAEREKTIANAHCMMDYHVSSINRRYETDMAKAEEEYASERQGVHDAMMAAIRDRRKQIMEDKDPGSPIANMFRDNRKRSLRKRTDSRKRQYRSNGLDGPASQKEELDHEYAFMKGLNNNSAVMAA
ncbi:Sds3-like-domain-containing protein [Dichotomocladium elegans]|nr:Sds3-like-domain-containing protein [Dichotomocladium elegans]